MPIIEKHNTIDRFPRFEIEPGSFQIETLPTRNKVADYFDQIYNYPPKFKIKWETIDELKEDLFIDSNYGVLEHSFPFIDFVQDWLFLEKPQEAKAEQFTFSDYINGYLDKLYTSKFYEKGTKELQKAVANIPVFVILNGNNEIVLNNPGNVLGSKNIKSYTKELLYDFCGAFDPQVEKRQQLGLFFFDRSDAETYLKEVAKADIDTTQLLGVSLHCISLDSAYQITREHHPGIDFRFVPNMSETKNLLTKHITDPNLIFEDGQQQLRFRRRSVNLFPYLGKLGRILTPTSSFLQRNEYFKGVPIFVVQTMETPRNIFSEQYFNIVGAIDTFYGRFIQSLDSTIGFGHNWIMQGSIQDTKNSGNIKNFVFFNKTQADNFVREQEKNVVRYKGSRTSNIETFVRKPKIYVYNLEDFLEGWEDTLYEKSFTTNEGARVDKTIFNSGPTYFINPTEDLQLLEKIDSSLQKTIGSSLRLKYQKFKRYAGVFFSVN